MKTKSSGGACRENRDVGSYRWPKVKSVFLLGFAAFALTAAGCASGSGSSGNVVDASQTPSSVVPDVTKPTSQEAFFRNVKIALDHGLLLRKDFYTKENMYRYFAAVKVASGVEDEGDGRKRLWMDTADFDGIFPRLRPDEFRLPLPGAQLGLIFRFGGNKKDETTVNFTEQRGSLTLDQLTKIFGGKFSLDKTIPHQPPPPPTGPNANEGWWYVLETPTGPIYGYFLLNSAGLLDHAFFSNKEIKTW